MLHRPDFLADPEEVAQAFSQLKAAGKVRCFGVSNFRPTLVTALQAACPMPLVAHQVEISLAKLDAFTDGTLDQCLIERITPMAWSPLAAGLIGDGAKRLLPSQESYRPERFLPALDGHRQGARRQPHGGGAGLAAEAPGQNPAHHRHHQSRPHPRSGESRRPGVDARGMVSLAHRGPRRTDALKYRLTSERYRLFIAVTVPEEVKAKMEAAQADLRRVLPDRNVRWARREQFHLTLRFLGDVEAARAERWRRRFVPRARDSGALQLRAERIGFFPDCAIRGSYGSACGTRRSSCPGCNRRWRPRRTGFTTEPKEERFTGHVTLARIKGIKRPEAEALGKAAAGMAERVFGQWTAYQIELMRSELLPQGARHTSCGRRAGRVARIGCPLAGIGMLRPADNNNNITS